jgi:hypothetical protein
MLFSGLIRSTRQRDRLTFAEKRGGEELVMRKGETGLEDERGRFSSGKKLVGKGTAWAYFTMGALDVWVRAKPQ